MSVGFSVGVNETSKVHNALKCMDIEIAETKGLSKISAVGLGLDTSGVASRFFRLSSVKIASHMISTSEIKIS